MSYLRRALKLIAAASVIVLTLPNLPSAAQSVPPGTHASPNTNLLFNGWGLTPAGEHIQVTDLMLRLILAPDGKTLAGVNGGFNSRGLTLLDLETGKVRQFLSLTQSWNGLAFGRDGKKIFVSGAASGRLYSLKYEGGLASEDISAQPLTDADETFLAGIAVHPKTGKVYVCNEANHEILVLAPDTLALLARIPVGQHPHSCIFGADKKFLYVSNWGNRSVSVVDADTNRRVRDIQVGLRPNDMALARDGRLFVACAGDNTVHVIQTETLEKEELGPSPTRRPPQAAREIIVTSLYPDSPEGSTPDALAVSPDGKTLFVANADNNSVMVGDIADENVTVVKGFIPTGWYPSALAVSADNRTLYVANGKGLNSRANFPPQLEKPRRLHKPPAFDYIGRVLQGSISKIPSPQGTDLAAYTEQVRKNSPYTPETFQRSVARSAGIVPDQVGQPCPIKYVLYIIKENRTYDQVFGDFKDAQGKPMGNGASNLTMYGEEVTPNHHQLARDYVLLDNLYCNGEVSVDGHSWCDAAIATDYNQRAWISSYSQHGKIPGNEEMENPAAGYLWDLCRRHGLNFRTYGEAVGHVPSANRGRWGGGRDMDKVQHWIDDLQAAEKTGALPRLTIMSLGEDHTRGTTPGAFAPDACVASNDLGLGRLVEAATRSRFWKEMCIFVIEDDAQNGPDHVDAHRTVGLVLSPYCKRQFLDSTPYTTASMVRTIELILGLPPMTQYDASATPMFNCFNKTVDVQLYAVHQPKVDLLAKNTKQSPYARASSRMNFSEYDLAPEDELNRILWVAAKGPNVPYPAPIHRMPPRF
jgi:YVTN family beta-propeller protein